MGYLYLLMGVIISPAVIPATLTLLWSDQSWAAATFAPPLGFACSILSWLVTTHAVSGEMTVETTGANTPMLVGNIVALLSPLIFIPILTYLPPFRPQRYDWQSMLSIRAADDRDVAEGDPERLPEEEEEPSAASAAAAAEQEEETAKLNKSATKIDRPSQQLANATPSSQAQRLSSKLLLRNRRLPLVSFA